MTKCTSKEIRAARANKLPITNYKVGIDVSKAEAMSWGLKLSKLTSTKLKLNLLKTVHGDIYTKVKLLKFGLTDDNICPSCDEVENLEHKIYSCEYIKRIWQLVATLTEEDLSQDPLRVIIGIDINQTVASLTVKAEILGRILGLPWEQSYLVHPKHFVTMAIKGLVKKEKRNEIKTELNDLLSRMVTREP